MVRRSHAHHNGGLGFAGSGDGILVEHSESSYNNRYDFNTYYLGANPRYFMWLGADRDEAQWRSYGHDVNGTNQR